MALEVVNSSPALSQTGSVYWIGGDGNVWFRAADGSTSNMGTASGTMTTANLTLNGSKQITDPLPGGTTASTNNTTGTGGSGTPAPVLDQASVDATQSGIDSLATTEATGRANIAGGYDSTIGQYDQEAGRAGVDYNENTVTNNQNFQKDTQNAMVAAAQGRRGLRGTLASMGALSGDGEVLADRAVTKGANDDIGEARDTTVANTGQLDKAKKRFDEDDAVRRAKAGTERTNQETALEGSVLSKRQQGLQKLAELFRAGGRSADADRYTGEAASLNEAIASKTAVASTPFTRGAAAFTPGKLAEYLAGAGDMTVDVTAGGSGGEGVSPTILAARRKKEEEALLPVAA